MQNTYQEKIGDLEIANSQVKKKNLRVESNLRLKAIFNPMVTNLKL